MYYALTILVAPILYGTSVNVSEELILRHRSKFDHVVINGREDRWMCIKYGIQRNTHIAHTIIL